MIHAHWTNSLQDPVYLDGLQIRKRVFVEEQGFSIEIEIDELEAQCEYLTLYSADNQALATARIYPYAEGVYKLQRIAVLPSQRGKKLGERLMLEMEKRVKGYGSRRAILGAQDSAIAFYQKCGYQVYGDGYEEEGVPHHMMEKRL
ncbi:GNAT family N-acetyltransferase [Testudinibacter sp. TR-2022]|uniref:GNAT family N-acetyltransferase n=1 Tax=Testudinibacter sp. TR-2022 TaxID=2585029 RepID=UPI00111AC815|nr:GNAT family N-acetyltransferase [Testudinibacter sp. TR-2022]TNH07838.1 GNAT family N-acetyltransferase [Pasteurellaceae bacterium Phil11]TNH24628.1 GNAT family N-acetyltransferase [Testudinibacter sp. TR-2022]TNH28116.1 GNAT family N-acetyltransferase [Testudinibacter sp. TR-2022]